jgi:flavocytochrome c
LEKFSCSPPRLIFFHSNQSQLMTYPLILVGAGTAGMPCAIAAAARGKQVLVIEKDQLVGGTLHLTAGHMSAAGTKRQRDMGISDTPEQHFAEVMEISRHTADAQIVQKATQLAPKTLDWLYDLGFPFDPATPAIIYGHVPYQVPRTHWGAADYAGGNIALPGISIFKTLLPLWGKYVAEGKIVLHLNTRMTALLTQNDRVVGVSTENSEGEKQDFFGEKVVLTTGGYASNHALFAEVTPDAPRLVTTARPTSTGDGILAARAIGAHFRNGHFHTSTLGGIELEPQSGRTDFWAHWARLSNAVDRKPREIYLNEQGERFMDENEPNPDIREKIVQKQTGRRFWVVFDEQALLDGECLIPKWSVAQLQAESLRERAVWQADTLEALAQKIGLPPEGVKENILRFNQSVAQQQDLDFGRTYLHHSISQPPFYAVLTYAFSLITFGGLHTNADLQVLDQAGKPIEGLYAAGEILGAGATSGFAFCGGMLLTPALSFGKWLGETL